MKTLGLALLLSAMNSHVSAGILEQMKTHQQLGYAQAAVAACGTLKINPAGVLTIIKELDATDQAAVASNGAMTDHQKGESAKLFTMLADSACDAALDYEKKLGIDIFKEK